MMDGGLAATEQGVFDAAEAREIVKESATREMSMPRGLVLAVARDMHAMEAYAKMSDGERATFLDKARHTPSGEPMRQLLRDLQREYK